MRVTRKSPILLSKPLLNMKYKVYIKEKFTNLTVGVEGWLSD